MVQVIDDCTKAIDLHEGYRDAYYLRAEAYQARGNVQKAKDDRTKARSLGEPLDPNPKEQNRIRPIY